MAEKREKKETKYVTTPLCELIKEDKLEELKGYIPVREFGIKIDDGLNIDIVAIDQKFGLEGYENSYDDVVAIECKYQTNINYAIQISLAQAILYQTSFKKVYIAANKDGSDPSHHVKNILERTGIGLITVNNKGTSKEIEIAIPANPSKSNFFCEDLYKKNTRDRASLIAAFARACEANGYSKRDLHFSWTGSKNRKGSKKISLHIWMEIHIIKDKLRIGCVYSLKLDENDKPEKVEKAALRISIKKSLVPDESVKKQIAHKFPDAGDDGKSMQDDQLGLLQEWDYDLHSLIEEENNKGIQKIIKDRVRWVNNNLKNKIS